jgi:UDP-GlcNAc:undecaprenyl-phosphate/decaprenyl-phosphate GlcNAc-1-phosphate transferase
MSFASATTILIAWLGAVFLLGTCASLLLTPLVIRAARALKLYDAPDGVRRLHASPVPRLGGVSVFLITSLVTIGVFYLGTVIFVPGHSIHPGDIRLLTGVLIGASLLFFVGLLDDVRGLPPSAKFVAQVAAALIAWYFGVRLESATLGYGVGVPVGILSAPLVLLWIIGVTNAYNFIDGLNGLAGGIAIVACATIAIVGVMLSNIAVLVPAVALGGAMLGFMHYNFPKARVFLGDSGSMSTGFLLAVLLLESAKVPGPSVLVVVPILALFVPLLDVMLAIIRRWLRGVPLSGADARHIHHRLMALGLSQERTSIFLWSLALAMAAFGLIMALTAPYVATSIALFGLVGLSILVIYGTNLLSYQELVVAGEVLLTAPSRVRRVISDQILALDLMARIENAERIDEVESLLSSTAHSFGFLRMELVREDASSSSSDREMPLAWAWKLEYPIRPPLNTGLGPAYKLSIWCSAEHNVRPYGAERAAKIIAPGLEHWLVGQASRMQDQPAASGYGVEAVVSSSPKRRPIAWRSRDR